VYWEENGEEEKNGQGEKRRKGGSSWRLGTAPGVASVLKRQAGGGIVGGERAPRSCSVFSAKKTRGKLSESPWLWRVFQEKQNRASFVCFSALHLFKTF
jgi:hypothetical protein